MAARLLVAEDDPEMLAVLVDALRADGYDIETASDGGRLLVALARPRHADDAIDLIVSDIRMPTCSGLQVLQAARASAQEVPVILMTAFGDDETRRRAEALGGVLFDKPFDAKHLRLAVKNLLARRRDLAKRRTQG